MRFNRLICVIAIIGSSIFASYYGGNISYALFYLTILIPIIAFFYTVYVYFRFKLYQSMESYLVVKGDWTMYSFIIANEDYITFRNVKVNFLSDKSTIESAHQTAEYSLLPSESDRLETRIKCNYRGEYYVGVDSIEITDFLYLFSITYPLTTKLKAVVLPRVVPLERLGIAPMQSDVKNPLRFSNTAEDELDTEIRKYNSGDSRKRIHWKASARMHELISRKYQHIPKKEIVLFMDLMKIDDEELNVVIAEDKIIESILAIANFYALRGTRSEIIYEMEGKKVASISSKDDFNAFYKACAAIHFHGKIPISELIKERLIRGEEGMFFVAATHSLTKEVYLTALQAISNGNHFSILLISNDVSENTKQLISSMKLSGIDVNQIMSEDELGDILSREII
jgi:DNA-binding Lrp family transcriptional regulator